MMLDSDARPGSVASQLRTFVGLFLRDLGGWISVSQLLTLLSEASIAPALARNALTRVKRQGLLEPESRTIAGTNIAGYRLGAGAEAMLSRGDERIFHERRIPEGGTWCLVSFTVEETRREVRHQARRQLHLLGADTVAPGLWIVGAHLTAEAQALLQHSDLTATIIHSQHITPFRSAAWWDLEALAATHETFIQHATALTEEPSAFVRYLHLVDRWRLIPSIDPGLPESALPNPWPGTRSLALFREGVLRDSRAALEHVQSTATHSPHKAREVVYTESHM